MHIDKRIKSHLKAKACISEITQIFRLGCVIKKLKNYRARLWIYEGRSTKTW